MGIFINIHQKKSVKIKKFLLNIKLCYIFHIFRNKYSFENTENTLKMISRSVQGFPFDEIYWKTI